MKKYADGGNASRNRQIAETILQQLGGAGRLRMMTGAYNFIAIDYGVSFRIKNPRANYIKITLTPMDLYDLEIGRVRGTTYKVIAKHEGVYYDMLKPLIEKATGMYLSLFAKGGKLVYDREKYVKLLDEYDKVGAYLEDATTEQERAKYKKKLSEIESELHRYERNYAKGGGVGKSKSYLHLYKLTYPNGQYRVESYDGEAMTPKEALEKMRISLRGLKSYKYSGASSDSENYKKWYQTKDMGYSDTDAWNKVFGSEKMAKGGAMKNKYADGGMVESTDTITLIFEGKQFPYDIKLVDGEFEDLDLNIKRGTPLYNWLSAEFDEWLQNSPNSETEEMYYGEERIYDKKGAIMDAMNIIYEDVSNQYPKKHTFNLDNYEIPYADSWDYYKRGGKVKGYAKGGAMKKHTVKYDKNMGGGMWIILNPQGKKVGDEFLNKENAQWYAKKFDEGYKSKFAKGGGIKTDRYKDFDLNTDGDFYLKDNDNEYIIKPSKNPKVEGEYVLIKNGKKVRRSTDLRSLFKFAKGGLMGKLKSTASNLGKSVKSGYSKGKQYAKDKLHQKKKDIALDVIYETKEKLAKGRDEMMATEKAYNVVDKRYSKGGAIRTFDRQKEMTAETRKEILALVSDLFMLSRKDDRYYTLQNSLYGLFDGYDYSQTGQFKKEMSLLKNDKSDKNNELYNRIQSVYKKVSGYNFDNTMAKGGKTSNASKIDLNIHRPWGDETMEVAKFKGMGDALISASALNEKSPVNYDYRVKPTSKYAKGGGVDMKLNTENAKSFNASLKKAFKEAGMNGVKVRIINSYNFPKCWVEVWFPNGTGEFSNDFRLRVFDASGFKRESLLNASDVSYGNIQKHSISAKVWEWEKVFNNEMAKGGAIDSVGSKAKNKFAEELGIASSRLNKFKFDGTDSMSALYKVVVSAKKSDSGLDENLIESKYEQAREDAKHHSMNVSTKGKMAQGGAIGGFNYSIGGL